MAYFSDSRCVFGKNKIQVQTAMPYYEPGQAITGRIDMLIGEPLHAQEVYLKIEGKEKTAFTRFWTETHGTGEHRRVVHKHERLKKRNEFLKWEQCVHKIDGVLNPGAYAIDFNMALPNSVPSSL